MQQLTIDNLSDIMQQHENIVRLDMPLPATPLKTQQWVDEFSRRFNLTATNSEWGADRYQVTLSNGTFDALLFIEWLCDAIWIEPIGSTLSSNDIYHYLLSQE